MTTWAFDGLMLGAMVSTTSSGSASIRSLSPATVVNAAAMAVAIAAIVWQIVAGVDYPAVPPGPIILGVAIAVVVFVRARWARVVGIVVPLFLVVGGTLATFGDDDAALRHADALSPFAATVLQMGAVAVAFVAGVVAFRDRRS